MDMYAYEELFKSEAEEYMQILNRCLLNLEKDPQNKEYLLEAFRASHSLKGMAATMGYQQITDIAHGLETYLEALKSDLMETSAKKLDLAFEGVDLLQHALKDPQDSDSGDVEKKNELLSKFNEARDRETSIEEVKQVGDLIGKKEQELLVQAICSGEKPYLVRLVLDEDTMMKSVRCHQVFQIMEECGEVIFSIPSREDLDEENFAFSFQVGMTLNSDFSPEALGERLLGIMDIAEAAIVPWEEAAFSAEKEENRTVSGQHTAREEKSASDSEETIVKVETHKLDNLINLVGELVVTKNRLEEFGLGYSEEVDSSLGHLKRVLADLQNTATRLRMVPIGQVFYRFPRMMRDICRERNKEIRLQISGEKTELDRTIINQLADPLVHLLRNAADHGIETPELRKSMGKEAEGTVFLKAHHEGNRIVITVEDDGAGIDMEKVAKKALDRGLISEEEVSGIDMDDIIPLILKSGFSTSEQITDISGRGVGMDAVRSKIEELHGSIKLESEPGVYTRFIIRLPLTLAIMKTLMVSVVGQVYSIPMDKVKEIVYLKEDELKESDGNLLATLREEEKSLYSLRELLGKGVSRNHSGTLTVVMVEDAGGKTAGLIVDEIVGHQEAMIKPVSEELVRQNVVSGAIVLGNGNVSLVLDIAGLLKMGEHLLSQQQDLLKELANIGVGNAVTSLSAMLKDQKIFIQVPEVSIMPLQEVPESCGDPENDVTAIYCEAKCGHYSILILFMLPLNAAKIIVERILPGSDPDFGEMERSLLMELGNIMTGSYLSALSFMTDDTYKALPPRLSIDMSGAVLGTIISESSVVDDYMVIVKTVLQIDDEEIEGNLLVLPEWNALQAIYQKIRCSTG